MRRLTRQAAPACLGNYRHGAQNWGDLTGADREEIRTHLALFFAQDGSVLARADLSAAERRRATETIRVFNLKDPDLCERRAAAVRSLLAMEPDILQVFAEIPDTERAVWLESYLSDYLVGPHPTPLRHLLTR